MKSTFGRAPAKMARKYSEEDIEAALTELAIHSGSFKLAVESLEKKGRPVTKAALERWKYRSHPERYREIQAKIRPQIKAEMAEKFTAQISKYVDLGDTVLDELRRRLENASELETKELTTIMRESNVGAGIYTDKASKALGEDQPQQPKLNYVVLVKQLERMGVVEGEATEVTAELEEGGSDG